MKAFMNNNLFKFAFLAYFIKPLRLRPIITFILALFLFQFFHICEVFSQKTIVSGIVTDYATKDALPFVNIAFLHSKISTITDQDGKFEIATSQKVDTLTVGCIGFTQKFITIKRNTEQFVKIELVPSDYTIEEVVVVPGENPAHPILRNIQKHKKENNPEKLDYFHCEVYNKLQVDLNNITDDLKNRKVFKNFQFIFEMEDSSELMKKTYLPVFITESYSQYYFQRKPERRKEIIVASRMSGLENKSYSEFTGQMYIDINLYDNYVSVFGKEFASPFSNTGLLVYKYYLQDSTIIDNDMYYYITYKPRRKQERTFYGDFWVSSKNWGIKKVNARISEDANINYVKDLIINQEFTFFGDSVWFKTKDEVFTDINLADKAQGFFGRKQTIYKNLDVNKPTDPNFFSDTQQTESILADTLDIKNIKQWNTLRPEQLTKEQEKIYDMVDSVKKVPLFKTVTDIIYMLAYGYYLYKDFEFGPYFKTYSFNPIEGNRFRLGGRTSNEFSTRLMLYGHVAYGTKDEAFKYGLGALYILKKVPRLSVNFYHENDLALLGQSVNAFSEDNLLASILSIRPNDNLLPVVGYNFGVEKEWFTGFSTELKLFHEVIKPSGKIPFESIDQTQAWNSLIVSEATINLRFAYNEKVIRGEFERVSLGSNYPIIKLELTKGLKNVFQSNFDYFRTRATISQTFDIKPFGYMKYSIGAGKIWGHVPFPLLILHEGNETYALDFEAYNLMNYYEFASDFYQSIYIEHHFQGLFLNKIPLIRKLKWREVIYGKFLNGTISESNKNIWAFPSTLTELRIPYIEAGVGLENIFKIIRIDAIWRISNLDKPEVQRFGIRAKLQLIF
jgi:hypothetical protein